ncbi:hypothetical protein [Endozoicomonas sp. ISHI1]|uniref:hypothetical protein n=1 Tax=Endozoicomonas sp. ISHI1 TaxID=2825882 RepID=UPI0021493181|nr:hypothetical protein [Endozoicomonas sp. ISHI1]
MFGIFGLSEHWLFGLFLPGGRNVIPDLRCDSVFAGVVMEKSLFSELKRIGIDEELASRVSASLDPEYNASKKDILVLQEAMLQIQARTDERYHELRIDMHKGFTDLRAEITDVRNDVATVRAEMDSMHRQYWITFGGLITTIFSVFAVNGYFH